ncbi:MAG: hypothetical protein GXO20_07440 [Thermodesulfobacteria bacterium]|nr:hypothetical protein [Thermodesulfobacteriota bacterium]
MQNFTVDRLSPEEISRLERVLKQKTQPSPLGGLFWIRIPEEVLAPVQKEHAQSCGPHYFAVEIGEDFISFEFLVRNFQRVRCSCMSPATPAQKVFLLELAKEIFRLAGVEMQK